MKGKSWWHAVITASPNVFPDIYQRSSGGAILCGEPDPNCQPLGSWNSHFPGKLDVGTTPWATETIAHGTNFGSLQTEKYARRAKDGICCLGVFVWNFPPCSSSSHLKVSPCKCCLFLVSVWKKAWGLDDCGDCSFASNNLDSFWCYGLYVLTLETEENQLGLGVSSDSSHLFSNNQLIQWWHGTQTNKPIQIALHVLYN